uniref:Immunoglobulin subtype domain-containing protein n=1 Tax=Periophthalmus magnuspinnatus TaxID=409849 RepID=A0A3B4AJQ9_9GOBI
MLTVLGQYGFISTQTHRFKVAEGGNITLTCLIYYFGNTKIFCKIDCDKKDNILVQTAGLSEQKGRFSIQHKDITDTHRSDSGLYQCGLEYGQRNATMSEFQIEVSHAPTSSYLAATFRTIVTTQLDNEYHSILP